MIDIRTIRLEPINIPAITPERLALRVYDYLSWQGLGGRLPSVETIKLVLGAVAALDEQENE